MSALERKSTILLAVLLSAHAVWLFTFFGSAYSSPDAPGYFVQARLIATQATTHLEPESPAQFIGNYWVDIGGGELRSKYPPGLPLVLAAAYRLGGPTVALAANAILATLSVLLLFLLARRWLTPLLALAAALILATATPFNHQALSGFAHVAVTAGLLAGLYFIDRWDETPRASLGFLAGLLIGSLPAIRYPAALLSLSLAAYAAYLAHRHRGRIANVLPLAAGAAIPVAALLAYNWMSYGSPFASGYSPTGEQSAFSLGFVRSHTVAHAEALLRDAGAVVVMGSLSLVLMTLRRATRERGLLLVGIVGPFTLAYLAYYLWYTRFLLPILPILVLATVCLARAAEARTRYLLVAGLLALHLVSSVPAGIGRMTDLGRDIERSELVVRDVAELVPGGSAVVAPRTVARILDYDGRWKLGDWSLLWAGPVPQPTTVPSPVTSEGERRPSPIQPGKAADLRQKYEGLDGHRRLREVLGDLVAWADGGDVYWVTDEQWRSAVASILGSTPSWERVGSIPVRDAVTDYDRPPWRWWVPDVPLDVYRLDRTSDLRTDRANDARSDPRG